MINRKIYNRINYLPIYMLKIIKSHNWDTGEITLSRVRTQDKILKFICQCHY